VDKHGSPVALVACKVLDVPRRNALVAPYRDAMVALCLQDGRGLDQSWTSFDKKRYPVVVKLMPLTPESGARAYLARLQGACLALGAPARCLVTWMWMLERSSNAEDMLAKVYAACDIEAPGAPDVAPAVDRPEINRKAIP